ncbi:MAG: hypothetical protein KBG01_04635 [Syntrophobacterales bacterium]|jgi:hypothetical protein|nr:hypothetical protein [Syntrophobacterales bacterium]
MGTINLEDIQPGMILEEAVVDRSGRILLGAGEEITDRHLRIFKMWGVTEAAVKNVGEEDVSAKTTASINPVMLQEAQNTLREHFRHADMGHAFNKEFFRLLSLRMAAWEGPK